MSERIFRITSLFIVFTLVFAIKAWGESSSDSNTGIKKTVTEMDRALTLAREVQALNRGDFDVNRRPFHPNSQLQLDVTTLSLSEKQN